MTPVTGFLICSDAAVAVVLLRAGAAKMVAPSLGAAALGELRPGRRAAPLGLIRFVAGIEICLALGVAVPALRLALHGALGVLGAGFVAVGLLGMLRGSSRPCGCFGGDSTRPLGGTGVLFGLAFLAAAAVGLTLPGARDGAAMAAYTTVLTVLASVGWLLVTHRRSARTVLGNLFRQSELTV